MDEIDTENKRSNFKETMARLEQFLEENEPKKKKDSSWKLPWSARTLSKKKLKEGYLVFLNIKRNGWGEFVKVPVEDGVALIGNTPHTVESYHVIMLKKGLGLVVQPEWSVEPFNPREHQQETKGTKNDSLGWTYIMNYIYKTQIKLKKDIAVGLYIIIGLAVLAGGYYLIQSGAFK